jgi:RND superfamily putative drug exporter
MAVTEKATERVPETRRRRPPILWVFLAGAIALFLLGGTGGSYQGKLSQVQKNDNAAYLPGSAESTKVDKETQQFDPIQTIPGFLIYQRTSGAHPGGYRQDQLRHPEAPRARRCCR